MLKRFSSLPVMALACAGLIITSPSAIAADVAMSPAQPTQMAQRAALTPLTLENLPAGFIEPPPAIAAQMRQQIAALGGQFQQSGINPDKFFVFVHPQTVQVIVGFTGQISDTATFDSYMEQARDPAMQALILSRIQQRLEGVENVSVSDYQWLEGFETVGDRAASVQMDLSLYNDTFKTQMVTFRRGGTGAFVALMRPQAEAAAIPLADLVQQIDQQSAIQ